jgi:hypothetical protein
MRRFVPSGPSGSGAVGDGGSRVSPGFARGTKSWGGNGITVQYPAGRAGEYEIPAGTRNLGPRAFARSALLTGVSLPDSLLEVGEYAFEGCRALLSVEIPGSIESDC